MYPMPPLRLSASQRSRLASSSARSMPATPTWSKPSSRARTSIRARSRARSPELSGVAMKEGLRGSGQYNQAHGLAARRGLFGRIRARHGSSRDRGGRHSRLHADAARGGRGLRRIAAPLARSPGDRGAVRPGQQRRRRLCRGAARAGRRARRAHHRGVRPEGLARRRGACVPRLRRSRRAARSPAGRAYSRKPISSSMPCSGPVPTVRSRGNFARPSSS